MFLLQDAVCFARKSLFWFNVTSWVKIDYLSFYIVYVNLWFQMWIIKGGQVALWKLKGVSRITGIHLPAQPACDMIIHTSVVQMHPIIHIRHFCILGPFNTVWMFISDTRNFSLTALDDLCFHSSTFSVPYWWYWYMQLAYGVNVRSLLRPWPLPSHPPALI